MSGKIINLTSRYFSSRHLHKQNSIYDMAFTRALYYPTIDIPEEGWLKSAVLFWDEIQTIVPSSVKDPYKNRLTRTLHDRGFLTPFDVNPDNRLVEGLSETVMKYINEASSFLVDVRASKTRIHSDKLPQLFRIHPEKLPYEIRHQLSRIIDDDGWLHTSAEFGSFYMSLLANKICEDKSLALLTDNPIASNLTDQVRLDARVQMGERDYYQRNQKTTVNLAQGLLTNLVVKGVKLAPTTSIEDVLRFKNNHRDELGQFRTNLLKLVTNVNKEASLNAIQEQVRDIYLDEFIPSLNNLEKALNGSKIKWLSDTILKIGLVSTSTTAILPAVVGLTVPQALLAGVGISMITTKIIYNQDKAEKIRTSPYSYLMLLEKEFEDRSIKNVIF